MEDIEDMAMPKEVEELLNNENKKEAGESNCLTIVQKFLYAEVLKRLNNFKIKYIKYAFKLTNLTKQLVEEAQIKKKELELQDFYKNIRLNWFCNKTGYLEQCIQNILYETTQLVTIVENINNNSNIDKSAMWDYATHNERNLYELLTFIDLVTDSGYEINIIDAGFIYDITLQLFNELVEIMDLMNYIYKSDLDKIEWSEISSITSSKGNIKNEESTNN